MNFPELVAEVVSITKRPDLGERISSAIKAATLKMHHSDFYYKDLHETAISFSEASHLQNFVPKEVGPNFRKAKYLRAWQGDADGSPGMFLQPIQLENTVDGYGALKTDVFYMAGQALQIRSSIPLYRALFGAYFHPVVTPAEAYTSWIADEYPYAIIYEAARTIFRSIGYQEQAAEYDRLAMEVLQELRLSNIDDIPVT